MGYIVAQMPVLFQSRPINRLQRLDEQLCPRPAAAHLIEVHDLLGMPRLIGVRLHLSCYALINPPD